MVKIMSNIKEKIISLIFVLSLPFFSLFLCGNYELKYIKYLIILSFLCAIFIKIKILKNNIFEKVNYKYLFLGDATNNILDEINYDADIIKAGHHGSKTSASYDLYSKVLPKLVIIQTGRTKKYNFPNKETTDLLKSLKIDYYQTNRDSTIKIYYTKIGSIIRPLW